MTAAASPATSTTSTTRARGLAALAGVAVALAYGLVVTLAGDPAVGGAPIPFVAFPIATLVAVLVGWGLLEILDRRMPGRAGNVWAITAVVVTVLSLGGPLTADADGTTKALLAVAHLLVAATVIPLMVRTTRHGA